MDKAMERQNLKKLILLFAIILLALFLRIFYLDQVPAGLDSDEAEFAFNAYSLSKYLRNENNEFLPYQVNTYGNYRPLSLAYFMAASIKVFGNTIFAVRFPSALFGTLAALIMFVVVKKITDRNFMSMAAAFLTAINPWHVFFSRGSAEQIMALDAIALMVLFLIEFNRQQKIRYLILIYIFAVLSFLTYSGIMPLIFLLAGATMVFELFKRRKIILIQFLPFIFFLILPTIPILLHNPGFLNGRLKQTSVFYGQGKEGIKLITEEQIRENGISRNTYQNFVTRIFHNVPFNTFKVVVDNWTKHLSFEFLYLKSGPPKRLQVPDVGNFLPVESVFMFFGLLLMFRHGKFGLFFLSLAFILFSFLPAGLTVQEVPSTARTIFALLGFFIIEGYFLWQLVEHKSKVMVIKGIKFLIIMVMTFQFASYLHNYLILQPRHQNWFRRPEMQEVAHLLAANERLYDKIWVVKNSTEPAFFYYFFNGLDPLPLIENYKKNFIGNWLDKNFYYVGDECVKMEGAKKNNLIVEKIECLTGKEPQKVIKYIYSTDGRKVLVMHE